MQMTQIKNNAALICVTYNERAVLFGLEFSLGQKVVLTPRGADNNIWKSHSILLSSL